MTPFVIQLAALASLTLLFVPGGSTSATNEDLPVSNFAGKGFQGWKVTGEAFSNGPIRGNDISRLGITNAEDDAVASSKASGDGQVGTLQSPEFKIQRKFIAFRVSGGDFEHDLCLNLLINGRIVKSATGWFSDRLTPESWDVTKYRKKKANIQIVDHARGDWGHISVDKIVQTDQPERLPVDTGVLYHETLRPQFHFTARQWTEARLNPGMRQEGWINDLNGLIYYDGEYHMFAQRWNKCWLHAVSRDLIHWQELEPAFWEEELNSGCQSGTCVVDYDNTSGLSPNKANPPMIAFWSRQDNRSQCLCYSLDHGRTWTFYKNNPLMEYPERDPKVFWFAPGKHWVMMLYGDGQYHILTSRNLLDWKDEHHPIKDSFECPDFFELPIDGNQANKKWVLIQGNGNYSIGSFDGVEFKEEVGRFPCDIGPNFYATQSWANVETGDGRRIQAAWMRGSDFPEMPFNQQISFPCELTLRTTPKGLRVFREPIKEIASLHDGEDKWTERQLEPNQTLNLEPSGQCFHIKAEVEIPEGAKLTFYVRGVPVILTSKTIESGTKPASVEDRVRSVEILVDRTSIETFVNHGEVSGTRFVLPHEDGISVKAEGRQVTIHLLTVSPLKSIWSREA